MDYFIWLVAHPVLAFFLLLAQFILFAILHNQAHNKVMHIILSIIFTPQNFIVNTIAISIVGLELPKWKEKEFITTARMQRWKTIDPGEDRLGFWRHHFANQLCSILNRFHAGHC